MNPLPTYTIEGQAVSDLEIQRKVRDLWGFEIHTLKRPTKRKKIVHARYALAHALRTYTDLSVPEIANFLSLDTTTMLYGLKRVPDLIKTDRKFRARYEALDRFCRGQCA